MGFRRSGVKIQFTPGQCVWYFGRPEISGLPVKQDDQMPIENVKHGKYIVELRPGYSIYKQVTAPQAGAFGARDLNGADFSLGWCFY